MSESLVQPVASVRGIPAELPEPPVGQRFTARIDDALPDGTFRAVIADRRLILALPEAANPGDTLDLVVTGSRPGLVTAQRADAPPAAPPALAPGQRFQARIEEALPDGTYRAKVAGSLLTLDLPEAASAGDTLDLVVTSVSPHLVGARHVATATAGHTLLSPAGQVLGALLAGNRQPPQAPTLAPALPLLPQPPEQAAVLAQALRQTITESGLFYEAHQAQWVAGRYSIESLRREPQARQTIPAPRKQDSAPPETSESHALLETAGKEFAVARAGGTAGLAANLQALVLQQLDAAATQQVVWRGEIWPDQALHWEIEAGERKGGGTDDEQTAPWTTRLRLALPRLGEIDAVLQIDAQKVSLAMTAAPEHAALLQQGLATLAASYAAAGLPPLSARLETHV